MFKNDIITAKDGKFTFPNLGDAYKEAIMITFIAIETVSLEYARIKMDSDKKVKKYSLMLDTQKEIIKKSTNFSGFIDTTFQFEYTDGEVKRIESNFFKKDIEKYAYAINKMFEYIYMLARKYNISDKLVEKLCGKAKKISEKMYSNNLKCHVLELIFQARVKILITKEHGIFDGKAYGLIVVLYALKELINNIDLDKSKQITLEFNTVNDELFFDASGNKKILNAIIDDTIIRVRDHLDYNINNDTFDRELGHVLYHMIKELIEKRYNK